VVGCFALKPAEHEVWDKDVSDLAKQNDIPVWEFQDHLTKPNDPNNINFPKFTKIIKDLKPNLIFVLGWRQMIGKEIRAIPNLGVVGIHFSLLPKFRGHAPLSWSIITNQDFTGLTLFFFEKGADTGDIVSQKKTKIETEDTVATLRKRLTFLTREAVEEIAEYLKKGQIPRRKQEEKNATLAAYRFPWHGEIDWSKTSLEIYNEIRAITHPYSGAFSYYGGTKVIIWEARLLPEFPKYVGGAGQVITKNSEGLVVITGDHAILVTQVQQEKGVKIDASNHPITTKESFEYKPYDEIQSLRREMSELRQLLKEIISRK